MQKARIQHPLFIACLSLLLLNDFYLKQAYANTFTGKLSDFTGIFVFAFFVGNLLPKTKKWISLTTALGFVLWKTPVVNPLIELFNDYMPYSIGRVVDYTDYWALLILPIAHYLLNKEAEDRFINWQPLQVSLMLLTGFAICATSRLPPEEIPAGTVYIGRDYKVKKSREDILAGIKEMGYNVEQIDSVMSITREGIKIKRRALSPFYQTDTVLIMKEGYPSPVDTLFDVNFRLYRINENKTRIKLINLTVKRPLGPIQQWETLKFLQKKYKKFMKKEIIDKLKE